MDEYKNCQRCGNRFKTSATGYTVNCPDCRKGSGQIRGKKVRAGKYKSIKCSGCGQNYSSLKCPNCGI